MLGCALSRTLNWTMWRTAARLAVVLAQSSLAIAAEIAEQPIWNINDSWTYARTAHADAQTHITERSRYSLVVRAKTQEYYTVEYSSSDSDGKPSQALQYWSMATNFVNRGGSGGKLQEFLWYTWPLTVGKTWETRWFHPTVGEAPWTAKVRGWEDITVPAGTFRALRIELENSCYYNSVDAGMCRQTDVVWYSPLVKRHVRLERRAYKDAYLGRNIEEELVSYTAQ
jgi:hypothetical protein